MAVTLKNSMNQVEEHVPGSALYVSPTLRLCPACNTPHPLTKFINTEAKTYSVLCRGCLTEDFKFQRQEKDVKAIQTVEKLTETLKKACKKTGNLIPVQQVLETLYKPIEKNGVSAFERIGKVYDKALTQALRENANIKEIELGVKVGDNIVKNAVEAEKRHGPPIDLGDLSEDELRDILMEPARQLLLTDEKFRKQLLNDPVVRKSLLGDAGVEVIEADTAATAEPELEELF